MSNDGNPVMIFAYTLPDVVFHLPVFSALLVPVRASRLMGKYNYIAWFSVIAALSV